MCVVVAIIVPSHQIITVNVYVCIHSMYEHACVGGHNSEECIALVGERKQGEREKETAAIED